MIVIKVDDNFMCACTGSFFAATTYENLVDFEMFPFSEEPVWILGVKYNLIHGKQHLYFFLWHIFQCFHISDCC